MKKRCLSLLLAVACTVSLLAGCGSEEAHRDADGAHTGKHEPITIQSPFRDLSPFLKVLEEQYPEIQLEVIPYSGANTTAYLQAELRAGDIPDIYVATVYVPGLEDLSDRLLDLSTYDFTNRYAEARLREVSDNGAIYMLPTSFTCLGITYNKTLLERNGWALPNTFAELEELAVKAREAGYELALDQISLPGYGFQYLCNILDTTFLNTLEGHDWQRRFLRGEATVRGTPEMMEALQTLERWRELGMLNGSSDGSADSETKAKMAEGNTLFMLGTTNNFKEGESDCEFGLMPYLSADGTQNALIMNVSRYIGLNRQLADAGNEQKLADAIHVMEVLSTVEGLTEMNKGLNNSTLLPLRDYVIPEDSYYKQVEGQLNAGLTAPFIYNGWEELIVPVGDVMLDYIKGKADIDDVIDAFDSNQSRLTDNSAAVYTTVTEKLDTADCARLVGICFCEATGADMALISLNKWYRTSGDEVSDLNLEGVSGALFPLPTTDQEITTILPTGWNGHIKTVTLTGKRVREIAEAGYDRGGMIFPYQLVTPEGMDIDDDTVYTVVICGASDEVAQEGKLTETDVLGLTAAQTYLSRFETLSKKDIRWE